MLQAKNATLERVDVFQANGGREREEHLDQTPHRHAGRGCASQKGLHVA